jgi:hypothetical protein
MNAQWRAAWMALVALMPGVAREPAAAATPVPLELLGAHNGSSAALASAMRAYLIKTFPDIHYDHSWNWGKTTRVLAAIKGKHVEKNNGTWKKVRITSPGFAKELVVVVNDIQEQENGTLTFALKLAFPARIDYTQQKWASGIKLYDASVRARIQLALALQCEVTVRLENGKSLVPDAVIHFRIRASDLKYDKLVVEHVAGLGGPAAKAIGDAILRGIKKRHPALERHLLEKANAAIVKAGSNKEVRVGLDKLIKIKK